MDVDQNGEAAQKYGVQAMPTFCVIDRTGALIYSKCGGSNAVVDECIQRCLWKWWRFWIKLILPYLIQTLIGKHIWWLFG